MFQNVEIELSDKKEEEETLDDFESFAMPA